jgi:oxygen-dependent protoporphyrinogen oxidase
MTCDTVIIGGGLSGLAAALKRKQQGESVLVLDRNELPGGVVRTSSSDGYLVEAGPNTLMVNDQRIMDLIEDLDLTVHLVEASPDASKRFLVKNGVPVAAPMSARDAVTTPLFSAGAKLGLLAEPFRKRGQVEEESLADFVRRRLGSEILDQAIQPVVSGVYAGDPERLAVKYAMPSLYQMEQEAGSLVAGAFRKMKKPAPHRIRRKLISFQSGLAELPVAMAMKLGESYINQAELTGIDRAGDGWQVTFGDGSGDGNSMQVETRHLILAIPAHALENLPLPVELKEQLKPLQTIPYAPVNVVALGFDRSQVEHALDGFGMLIPDQEQQPILGTLFSSTLFPGRAPEGKVLLTSFIGGRLHPERAAGSDVQLVDQTVVALQHLLGVKGLPEFQQIHRWPRAIPQMEIGHGRYLEIIEQVERDWPGLNIAGNFRHGISAPQCLLAGQ